ncbi:MAG: hypothetical protein WA705_18495 [Candidatus Ozemobacteraceae bacterium]
MKKVNLTILFSLALAFSSASLNLQARDFQPGQVQSDYQKQWATVLDLMQQPKLSATSQEKLNFIVDELVDISAFDPDGLNIAMYAAALGNLEVIIRIDSRSHSALLQRHPKTGLSLLHFAAQAKGNKGSAILNWYFKKYSAEALRMVNSRAFNSKGKGNGHTVAMEAVFTKRIETVKTLLDLSSSASNIDFVTPAITGWGPKTIAEREKLSIAASIPACVVPADQRVAWGIEQDRLYLESISDAELRASEENGIQFLKFVAEGKITEALAMVQASKVSINGTYGRLQATALGTVTTTSANRTPAEVTLQTRAILDAGADPRVAEGSLMFVHGAFRSAVFGYSDALRFILDKVEKDHGKAGLVQLLNTRGPENGVTMGLDAAWRRRADVLQLWIDRGGDPRIMSFAGETILQAMEEWESESKANSTITPPPQELMERIKNFGR